MSTAEVILWLGVALAGLIGSALCSGAESAFYWLNRIRLEVRSADPADRRARRLARELRAPDRVLTSLLIANNAFNYLGVLGVTRLLAGAGIPEAGQIVINTLLLTPVLLITAESLPKEVFRVRAETLAYAWAPALTLLRTCLTWTGLLPLVTAIGRAVARAAGADHPDEITADARRRIALQIHESSAHGAVSPAQAALVERALTLRAMTVEDEMVAWHRVVRVPADLPPAQALRLIARAPHGSYPAVDSAGRVVGVLWALDLRTSRDRPIRSMLLEPARLAPETPVLDAVAIVRASPARVGIVERNGRPIGLVTVKDLAEPLTGRLHAW